MAKAATARTEKSSKTDAGTVLHIRSNDELDQLLETELRGLRRAGVSGVVNKSMVVRALLLGVLRAKRGEVLRDGAGRPVDGTDLADYLVRATAQELMAQVILAFEAAGERAVGEMVSRLPQVINEELGLGDSAAVEAPAPAAAE